jgi:hypothetical protein
MHPFIRKSTGHADMCHATWGSGEMLPLSFLVLWWKLLSQEEGSKDMLLHTKDEEWRL